MTKTRKIIFGSVLAAVAILLVIGGLYDKTISITIGDRENFATKLFESFGIFAPFVLVSSAFASLFFLVKKEDKYCALKKCACLALIVIPYLAYGFIGSETFLKTFWARAVVAVITAAVLSPLTYLFFRKKREERLRQYAIFLVFATVVCAVSMIAAYAIKFVWGRVRFYEMMEAGDVDMKAFTPWYRPNGFSLHGHHSFPSGHTVAAGSLLVLCALDEVFPEAAKKKGVVTFVVGMYIFTLAYSRIVRCAHFLSDVTVGFLISYLTFVVTRYLYFDKSKTVVSAIMDLNAEEKEHESEEGEESDSEEDMSEESDEGLLLYKDRHPIRDVDEEAEAVKAEADEYEPDEDVTEQGADDGMLLYKRRRDLRAEEGKEPDPEQDDVEDVEDEDEEY